jgi:nicotinamidase-related amidase
MNDQTIAEPSDGVLRLPLRYYRLYPPERFEGETTEMSEVSTAATAFCLVDVYGVGHHPDDPAPHEYPALSAVGSLPVEGRIIRERILPALDAARRAGLPIVYVNNSAPRIALERSTFSLWIENQMGCSMADAFGETGADGFEYTKSDSTFVSISKLLAPEPGDYFIRKHGYSGFFGTRLDLLLRNLGAKHIIFVGFSLDCCLLATMMDAIQLEYRVIFLRDATLALDLDEERDDLRFTKRMVTLAEMNTGMSTTTAEFTRACDAVRDGVSSEKDRVNLGAAG